MAKVLLVEQERVLRTARKAQRELPDLAQLRDARQMAEVRVADAVRSHRLAYGRSWIGLAEKGDVDNAKRQVDIARAKLAEVEAAIEEAEATRQALDELLPVAHEEARALVGARLEAESKRVALELLDVLRKLEAKQSEADELADLIERQFTESTFDGSSRRVSYFRHRGPWLGVLRCWGRYGSPGRHPVTVPDRVRRFEQLLKECGIA
jgi:hypothetical protein